MEIDLKHFRSVKKAINHLKDTLDLGFDLIKIEIWKTRVVLLSYSSFANASELKSQIGFVILVANDQQRSCIVHYGSCPSRRVS